MSEPAIQIINTTAEKTITLNKELLSNILTRDDIKDRYVSVISINGEFRLGKSFFLNFLLRYLRIKYVERRDVSEWLTAEDGPLSGFHWSPGSTKDTNGILMWPEIFLTQLPSGDKVAIILLDTQGAFDNNSSMTDCATIFGLSTLLSSVQIFNVMRGIKQYDLSHLQSFGSFGQLLRNSSNSSPFQNLCILVRDWPCAYEKPFGFEGGSDLLKEIWKTETPEVKEQNNVVKQLFNKISCFLLPSPGKSVETSNTFKGDLNEIDYEFKKYVQEFVPAFLSPENLVLKKFGGNYVTAEDLKCHIENYARILEDGSLPPIENFFKTTVESSHKIAALKALKSYKKNMDVSCKDNPYSQSADELLKLHTSMKKEAVAEYNRLKTYKDTEISDKYQELLEDDIEKEFKEYEKDNEGKRRNEEEERKRKAVEQQRKIEKQRKIEELRKKQEAERRRRMEISRAQQSQSDQGGLLTTDTLQTVGTAVGVIGAAAAIGFGLSKLFNSGRNNE